MQLRDDIVLVCNTSFFSLLLRILRRVLLREFYILNNIYVHISIQLHPVYVIIYRIAKSYDIIHLFPKILRMKGEAEEICKLPRAWLSYFSPLRDLRSSKVGAAPVCSRPGTTSTACLILFSRPRRARLLSQFNANEPVSSNYSN